MKKLMLSAVVVLLFTSIERLRRDAREWQASLDKFLSM
jgi:hypothetical protein